MPRALSSVLTGAQTPQPRSLGILNPVDFMDLLSNYYLDLTFPRETAVSLPASAVCMRYDAHNIYV